MKKIANCLSLLFLLLACAKSDKDKLVDELIVVLERAMADKMREGEIAHAEYFNSKINRSLTDEEFSEIDQVHAVAKRFYGFTDSFSARYDRGTYPAEELLIRFNLSADSISAHLPEMETSRFDYTQSQHQTHLLMLIIRMNYDIAILETNTMNGLAEKYEVVIIQDEFNIDHPK